MVTTRKKNASKISIRSKIILTVSAIALALVTLEVTLPEECRLGSEQRSSLHCHRMMAP